jgi:hypothetical protein
MRCPCGWQAAAARWRYHPDQADWMDRSDASAPKAPGNGSVPVGRLAWDERAPVQVHVDDQRLACGKRSARTGTAPV